MDDANEIKLDVEQFEDSDLFPEELVEVLEEFPFLVGGEGEDELALIQRGKCICDHKPLGEDTVIVLNAAGISSIVCSGVCHDSLVTLGFLNEQGTDILGSIDARRRIAGSGGHD